MSDRTQTLLVEQKRIQTIVSALEEGADTALSAASKSARESRPDLQAEYLNERDVLLAFAAELRKPRSWPERLEEAIEAGRQGIEADDCYTRPWPEPASSYSLAKAAVTAATPLLSQPEHQGDEGSLRDAAVQVLKLMDESEFSSTISRDEWMKQGERFFGAKDALAAALAQPPAPGLRDQERCTCPRDERSAQCPVHGHRPAATQVEGEPDVRKFCPRHGEVDQVGIYCNQPMGRRLACGEELRVEQPEGGDEEDWPEELWQTLGGKSVSAQQARELREIGREVRRYLPAKEDGP